MNHKLEIVLTVLFIVLVLVGCGEADKKDAPLAKASNTKQKASSVNEEKKDSRNEEMASLTPKQKLGKRLFILCEACHNVKKGEPHKVGPNLHGVFGRKAGAVPGFVYSEAILKTDIVWSDETIREWLKNPNDYIPGTNMVFVGLNKEHQQNALLGYLHHVTE